MLVSNCKAREQAAKVPCSVDQDLLTSRSPQSPTSTVICKLVKSWIQVSKIWVLSILKLFSQCQARHVDSRTARILL